MRLAQFILANIEPILADWEAFGLSLAPGGTMTAIALRDDAELILRNAARDMQNPQTLAQQASKSKGEGGAGGTDSDGLDQASVSHGVGRVGSGFHIGDVVAEYRALRASVVRLWLESRPDPDVNDLADLTRFHESIDQSLAKAVVSYTERVDRSRRMFLAILSHDLRSPLNCIRIAAQMVARTYPDPDAVEATGMIERSTQAIVSLLNDLVDFTSSGLGTAMPMTRGPVNLTKLCGEVIDGFRTTHPDRTLRCHSAGEVTGVWDAGRMRQILTNLVGNAMQHGSAEEPVDVTLAVEGTGDEAAGSEERGANGPTVVLTVHNGGEPIPQEVLPTIFDPLVRYGTREAAARRKQGSIGLGLYIVREIVTAKGGTVEVTSSGKDGTTFSVRIPRFLPTSGDRAK